MTSATSTPSAEEHGLTPALVALRLGVSRRTVYRLIERGDLRAVRVGPRLVRIPEPWLATYLEQHPVP